MHICMTPKNDKNEKKSNNIISVFKLNLLVKLEFLLY